MQIPGKSFIVLMLAAAVLAAPPMASAQGFKWWQHERFQKELALTAEQIARLEGLYQATESTLRAQMQALGRAEATLSKVIADSASDEPAVMQASDRVDAARNELSRTRTLMLFRMRRILSDEQNLAMQRMRDRDRDRRPKGDKPHGPEPSTQ